MAFNFFGTFTTGQFAVFRAFAQIQILELKLRRQWLQKQLTMNGVFVTDYEGPIPVSFNASGYAGKLIQAYKVLGGKPERDMLLRTRDQVVFKERSFNMSVSSDGGVTGGFSDVYTSGRRERGGQRFDRDLGIKVMKVKSWQLESIKMKRERLEMKIKRALDYSDQLEVEIDIIDRLVSEDEEGVNVAYEQIQDVEIQALTTGAANVVDNLDDVFGMFIGRIGDLTFDDALEVEQAEDQRVPA
jgi:hypothetical protein